MKHYDKKVIYKYLSKVYNHCIQLLKRYDKYKEFLFMFSFYSKKSGPTRDLVLLEMHNTKMVINGVLLILS